MRFVLDASVALAWFLPDEAPEVTRYAAAVLAHIKAQQAFCVVPHVWHAEVGGKILRRLRANRLSQEAFDRAEAFYHGMPIETRQSDHTLRSLVERARRYHLQAIDVLYFEIALDLGLAIATVDRGLRAGAQRHGVKLFAPPA